MQVLRQHAKRLTAKAEAKAAVSAANATSTAESAATELLEEVEAEKKAAAKTGKGKKKKAKAVPSAVAAESAAAAPLGPAALEVGMPEGVWHTAREGDAQAVAAWLDEGGGVDARCAERGGGSLVMVATYGGQA